MQAEYLAHSGPKPLLVVVERAETSNINADEVALRLTSDNPFSKRASRATGRGDTDGVEAGSDVEVPHLGSFTQNELVVGCEGLRAVVELLDARGVEHRHAMKRGLHEDLEVFPVLIQQLKLERVWNLRRRHPRFGDRLEPTDDEPADFFLHVGVAVGVAQDRGHALHALDEFCDDVEVLCGVKGHGDAGHQADGVRPLSGAVDDDLGLDGALVGDDAGGGTVGDDDIQHTHPLHHARTTVARTLGERLCDVGGVGGAVLGQPKGALQIRGLQMRPQLEGTVGGDDLALQVVGLGCSSGAQQLHHALRRASHRDSAALLPASGEPGLLLERCIQLR